MKRFLTFALICIPALFSGCAKTGTEAHNDLVAILGSSKNDYWQNMSNGIASEAGSFNITTLDIWYTNADNDADSQLKAIKELSKYKDLKGIIISPINQEVESAAYDAGRSNDVPVVIIDSPVTEGTPLFEKARSQIYTDNAAVTETLYTLAREDNNKYILFVGKDNSNSSRARRAKAKELEEENGLTYREIVTDIESGDIETRLKEALDAHPEISAVICFNGSLITEKFLDIAANKSIYTFDFTSLIETAVREGKIKCAARQYTFEMGVAAVDAVFNPLILNPYIFDVELIDQAYLNRTLR